MRRVRAPAVPNRFQRRNSRIVRESSRDVTGDVTRIAVTPRPVYLLLRVARIVRALPPMKPAVRWLIAAAVLALIVQAARWVDPGALVRALAQAALPLVVL